MFMIMFVLDNPAQLDAVLDTWEKAGIRGVTLVESSGIHRRRKMLLPMRYVFQTSGDVEESHFTLFAIVDTEAVVQACLQATEQLVGNLDDPNTGVFAAWPLAVVKGLPIGPESE
jgi:hypothetical protein